MISTSNCWKAQSNWVHTYNICRPKNLTWKAWHGKTSRPHAWRLMSIGIGGFRYTRRTGQRSGAQKPVNILFLWILFQTTPVKNVWPPRSQSACSQVSSVLFYFRAAKFVGGPICVGDVRVSHLQVKGRQHHLSQNIGPAIAGSQTCSASPVREKWMRKGNSGVYH